MTLHIVHKAICKLERPIRYVMFHSASVQNESKQLLWDSVLFYIIVFWRE